MTIEEYEKYVAELMLSIKKDLEDVHSVIGHYTSAEMVLLRAKFSVDLIKDHNNNYLLSQHSEP